MREYKRGGNKRREERGQRAKKELGVCVQGCVSAGWITRIHRDRHAFQPAHSDHIRCPRSSIRKEWADREANGTRTAVREERREKEKRRAARMAHAATARKREKKREAEGEREGGEREGERESRSRVEQSERTQRCLALAVATRVVCVCFLVYLVSSSIAAGFSR